MPVFAYKAFDPRQQAQAGTVAADTAALARQLLRARGLLVSDIQSVKERSTSPGRKIIRFGQKRGSDEQTAELWRNLSVLLRAGVPLSEALDVCLRQQRGAIQTVLRQLHESVRNGQSLTDSLAQHAGWFDPITLSIVRVGEQSGSLPTSLAELAEYQGRRRHTANRFSTALIYPAILCVVGTAVVIFLMSYVVPQLVEVLISAGRELPAPTRLLKGLSDGLVNHALLLGGAGLAGITAIVLIRRTRWGQRRIEQMMLSIPVMGDLLRKAWVARISMMLSTMLKSDVRFLEAVRTVRQGLPHQLYAEQLVQLEKAIEAGQPIADPLRGSRLIPPLMVHLLAVGQESGELPAMLGQLRDTYDKEVQLALARFLAVLEPALILVLAVVIGFVVFATLLPILETTKIVQ